MRSLTSLKAAAVAGAVALTGLTAGSAQAQYQWQYGAAPAGVAAGGIGAANPFFARGSALVNTMPGGYGATFGYLNPVAGYRDPYSGGGWGPGFGFGLPDVYGGYLQGAASVYNAQGQYLIQYQQSRLAREQVKQSQIDTRRKSVDQWLYERSVLPTAEDERQRDRREAVKRALNDPPDTEIWAGISLNVLLSHLQELAARGAAGPAVPLNPAMLERINVAGGRANTTGANSGLLRNGGKLDFPPTLLGDDFTDSRKALEASFAAAVKQAAAGQPVGGDAMKRLTGDLEKMQGQLLAKVRDIPGSDYIRARRYLTQIEGGVAMLQDPNVANVFNKTWTAQGATVQDLVKNMTQNGLQFAPATAGDESAYVALQRAMAAYDSAATSQVVTQK